MFAMVLVAGMLLPLAAVLQAKQAVGDAADAAALAGADAAIGIIPGFPCTVAARVAEADAVAIRGCQVDGEVVTVRVQREVFGFAVTVTATAGPPPTVAN